VLTVCLTGPALSGVCSSQVVLGLCGPHKLCLMPGEHNMVTAWLITALTDVGVLPSKHLRHIV
jgi:hypothetical protein